MEPAQQIRTHPRVLVQEIMLGQIAIFVHQIGMARIANFSTGPVSIATAMGDAQFQDNSYASAIIIGKVFSAIRVPSGFMERHAKHTAMIG